jgi:hypothetical protein
MRREGLLYSNRFLRHKMAATSGTSASTINITDVVPVLCILTTGAAVAALLLAAELCVKKNLSRCKAFKY